MDAHRNGQSSGALATGRLTCLVIENGRGGRFIFTR
jgi:hypothetical protein